MKLYENSDQTIALNEMFINVSGHLPTSVESSIYYAKLKQVLHGEIFNFCKEQRDMKEDLNILRMSIGEPLTLAEIRRHLDALKEKYNSKYDNIGIDYHIETTKIDYGVPVFVVIKRGTEILMKKFVFRFKKSNITTGLEDLSNSGIPINNEEGDE